MATTFTFARLARSSNRIMYSVSVLVDGGSTSGSSSGGAFPNNLDNAALIADTNGIGDIAGPIDNLLSANYANTAAFTAAFFVTDPGGGQFVITRVDSATGIASLAVNPTVAAGALALPCTITCSANGTYQFTLEMQYRNINYRYPQAL